MRTLYSLMRTRKNLPVGYPSKDWSGPSTIKPEVFLRQTSEKEDPSY
jgi:hypothetical protein